MCMYIGMGDKSMKDLTLVTGARQKGRHGVKKSSGQFHRHARQRVGPLMSEDTGRWELRGKGGGLSK